MPHTKYTCVPGLRDLDWLRADCLTFGSVNSTFTIPRQTSPMRNRNSPLSPEVWLADIFDCKAVVKGEVIRRKARDIERFAGMDLFLSEIDRRGFRAVENAGQIIIFCNNAPVRILARRETLSSKESVHEIL